MTTPPFEDKYVCPHCGYVDVPPSDPCKLCGKPRDLAKQAQEIQDEVRRCVIGAVKAGVKLVQMQEYLDRFYSELNGRPLEERIEHLEFLATCGDYYDLPVNEVVDVSFSAHAFPAEDEPTQIVVRVSPKVQLRPQFTHVDVSFRINTNGAHAD